MKKALFSILLCVTPFLALAESLTDQIRSLEFKDEVHIFQGWQFERPEAKADEFLTFLSDGKVFRFFPKDEKSALSSIEYRTNSYGVLKAIRFNLKDNHNHTYYLPVCDKATSRKPDIKSDTLPAPIRDLAAANSDDEAIGTIIQILFIIPAELQKSNADSAIDISSLGYDIIHVGDPLRKVNLSEAKSFFQTGQLFMYNGQLKRMEDINSKSDFPNNIRDRNDLLSKTLVAAYEQASRRIGDFNSSFLEPGRLIEVIEHASDVTKIENDSTTRPQR